MNTYKLSPIKYFLLIKDFDKASSNFWSSKLSLEDKTTLEILLRFSKGNLSTILLTEEGISSGSNAVLSCGFSIADFIKAFLQVEAIVVSAQSSISLHCANNIGSSGKSGLFSFFLSIYSQIVEESLII